MGFDKEARALIQQMLDAGWTGRVAKSSHVIMRAPDGVTTCSIPRKMAGRRLANYTAPYRKWLRDQQS